MCMRRRERVGEDNLMTRKIVLTEGEIHISKYTREFLFLMSVERAYKEAKLLNVCSMIVDLLWAVLLAYMKMVA